MSDNFSAINIKVNDQWVPAVVLKGDKGDSFRYENLTEEQLKELKKRLNTGELPSNVATIDKEGKVGNVYDKSQVVNLLETNSKNISNADLQIPAGTVRTLNVTGAKLGIQGLENKSSDKAFNSRVVMNKFGHIAINDNPEIITNFTVPDRINLNVTENFANVTFNKKPNYSQDIIDALNFIKTINDKDYTKFRVNEIIPYHIADEDLPTEIANDAKKKEALQHYVSVSKDGILSVNGDKGQNLKAIYTQEYKTTMSVNEKKAVFNVVFDKEMPEDKDWIITFYTDFPSDGPSHRLSGAYFGFRESKIEKCDCDIYKSVLMTSRDWQAETRLIVLDNFRDKRGLAAQNIRFWAIKKGSTLTIMLQSLESGQVLIDIRPYKTEHKFLHFYKSLEATSTEMANGYYYNFKNLSYWIAN